MLADFCLRLAAGMAACLLLLSPASSARPGRKALAHPNFFRTHCLTVLALSFGALLWTWTEGPPALSACLGAAALCACLGSAAWSVERSPGAVTLILGMAVALVAGLCVQEGEGAARLAGALEPAALLGAALSAMLMGHSYLVAPGMSLGPLYRLLAALAAALAVRAAVDGAALWGWRSERSWGELSADAALWLPVRWLVGVAGPAVLCWMAWQTARIRSTQSATGILYVVVVLCFVGELTGRLLRGSGVTY